MYIITFRNKLENINFYINITYLHNTCCNYTFSWDHGNDKKLAKSSHSFILASYGTKKKSIKGNA